MATTKRLQAFSLKSMLAGRERDSQPGTKAEVHARLSVVVDRQTRRQLESQAGYCWSTGR